MRRTWPLWGVFGLCLAGGLAAMVWISLTILRLDRVKAEAARQAVIEENVRLALWRMDSALSPAIAAEIARPYFAYSAFTPAERAYTRMFSQIDYGDVLVPSPLLVFDSPLIHLHFQFSPDGSISSPQVPTGNMRDLATQHATRQRLHESAARLEQLRELVTRDALLAALPDEPADATPAPSPPPLAQPQAPAPGGAVLQQQALRSVQEYQARGNTASKISNYEIAANRAAVQFDRQPHRVHEGIMRPLWIGDALVLARRVMVNGQPYVQGCWLNWNEIRAMLLADIRDLLPAAQLQPASPDRQDRQPRRLASLPVKLIPGPVPAQIIEPGSPVRMTLLIAWIGVILACAAMAALLWGAIRLSHRRGAFVSAVTHELRTPLTTVSMYAEMLQEGMIGDESRRRKYLATLRAEADRLGHLVENVLAYSRIERGGANGRIQTIPLTDLINDVQSRLATRIEQANLQLCMTAHDGCAGRQVRADAAAVEQILLNLVDNAGKYARGTDDRRLHIEADCDGRFASIRVRDHGPGIAPTDARRLFRPFSKSARDAANSAPGVGLGLALSRRLAREMGGDLRLESPPDGGACFILTLPLA